MLALAFLLDLWVGDPVYPFHPVRIMGQIVERGETFLRRIVCHEKMAGTILASLLPLAVFFLTLGLIFWLGKIHFWLAWGTNLFGIYSALSIHDLRKEGIHIFRALEQNDLDKARKNLARIVGRSTDGLDQKEILRASIETIAESTVDGIIAPLFYAALGGAPLALAYKAVNTLDSMIGHLNERYRNFGFFAAKQDEFWNWIPARLSYFAISFAAFILNFRIKEAFVAGWRNGIVASYGNGAIPEATFAGALGLRLGGVNRYEGQVVEKPFLGFKQKDFDLMDLKKSLNLMMAASWVALVGIILLKYWMDVMIRI